MSAHDPQRGQATTELALLAPLLLLAMLFVVQVFVVVRDRVFLVHTLREAAVSVSATSDPQEARAAVARVLPGATMTRTETGVRIAVDVLLHTDVPIVGRFVPDLEVHDSIDLAVEWD